MPAKTKLTPQLLDEMVAHVRAGNPLKDILKAKGINEGTVWRWQKRAVERPGSIYAAFLQRMTAAQAEFSLLHVTNLTRAATTGSVTVKTVTKREARAEGQLVVTEETITRLEKPPDPKWSAWLLQRRNPAFRDVQQVEALVGTVPRDMMQRTIAERLRVLQGGNPNDRAASYVTDDDALMRELMSG